MKKKKNSFLRLLKMLLLSSLAGGIIGGMVGAFLGYHGGRLDHLTFLKEDVINLIILLNRLVVVTGLTLSFVFLTQLKKETTVYNTVEEDDYSEKGYRQLNKKHAYTMLLIAVASILSMCNVLLGLTLTNDSQHAMLGHSASGYPFITNDHSFSSFSHETLQCHSGNQCSLFSKFERIKT